MTSSLFSSDLLRRLRRSLLLSGVMFISFFAGICGDDDDDDDGTGPSADCIDEIDFTGAPPGVDENDAEAISVGDSESGSLTTSDPEDEDGFFFDFFALGTESDGEVTIDLNPSGFDAVLVLFDSDLNLVDVSDDPEDPDATESITTDLDEGCYVIFITSFDAGETGSYTLSVD